MPPKRRVVDESAWVKGWNNPSICADVRPMPVSATQNERRGSADPASLQRTRIRTPPESVNLIALPTRLVRICRRRVGSPEIVSGIGVR